IILQTLPAVALGLYTRWFHRGALIAGWVAGMGLGMWMLYQIPGAGGRQHFGGSAFSLGEFGFDTTRTVYVGLVAVLVNLLVAVLGTLILRATKVTDGADGTTTDDYHADEGDAQFVPAPRREAGVDAPEPVA
ncbi:sodium:solute symporter, partial [Micromonospora sp. NPDC005113]